MVRFEGFLARFHVRNAWQSDDLTSHDLACLEVFGRVSRISTQEWQLLHAHGAIVERFAQPVCYDPRGHYTYHHGQKDVNRRSRLKHDDYERVCKPAIR